MKIKFYWSDQNTDHIAEHGVVPSEAEYVIRRASNGFPRAIGNDKHLVHGQSRAGRWLQVIFVLKRIDELTPEGWGLDSLDAPGDNERIMVIHARDLTDSERRAFRKRR